MGIIIMLYAYFILMSAVKMKKIYKKREQMANLDGSLLSWNIFNISLTLKLSSKLVFISKFLTFFMNVDFSHVKQCEAIFFSAHNIWHEQNLAVGEGERDANGIFCLHEQSTE